MLTKDREIIKKRAIEKEGFIATCNKINVSLIDIFQRFKDHPSFGLWIFNKNGRVGTGKATSIIYSQGIGTKEDVEKALQITYNTKELD